ncbi:putative two-component system sensor kinase [Actinoplanes missouriensis 431]|uniref:Putative two-component system sensor kinase n=1 Tax=Actinoplanes missouriensis (strain ATCC 14538 / DSM 43046 / CBS 188.64 / JCM 3121 / NBRC 102363 / NCIMB 12654 / NRRL B-3342 / UNCC 431) TaxID=512565 RepID=I0HFQ1_ACTM4|nr:putative two-component system sensor kinase [Actinoplanes missouriensis 431]
MIAAAVLAAVVIVDGFSSLERGVALAALTAMIVLHVVIGRPLILRDYPDNTSRVVLLVQLTLFAIAIFAVPLSTWLMFAVIPLIFQMVTVRLAIVLIVVTNLVPPVADLLNDPEGSVGLDLVIAAISTGAGICMGLWIMRALAQSDERAALIVELEASRAALEASRAELARLSHEAGAAAERNRLAGEIHDTLAQGFTSIITLVQAADPQLADERLALAVRTARENLAESRALIAALSPAALASASLPEAVRRQAARFSEEAGVPSTVRVTGEPRDLPTRVEVVLLRAAQEALTNVRRHAGATEVGVVLAYAASSVRLVVRDDGRGFDPAGVRSAGGGGFGLSNIRARAAQVGGQVAVRSGGPGAAAAVGGAAVGGSAVGGAAMGDAAAVSGTIIELEIPA